MMPARAMDTLPLSRLRHRTFAAFSALVLTPCAVSAFVACSSSNSVAPGEDGGHEGGDAMHGDAGGDGSHPNDAGAPLGVLQHHADGTRGGFYIDPAFTKKALPNLEALPGFGATLNASVLSQVLFLQKGAKGTDALYVVTEANDVLALNADTGAELWKTNLGTPEPQSAGPHFEGQPCGTVWPLGITGTPIIDLPSRSILVSAMTMKAGVPDFTVASLSVDDGTVAWTVDLNATVPEFSSLPQMQRGALALQNGVLYVPFGGQAGGCVPFHGWVIGVPLAAPHKPTGWHTGSSGAGIWAPSGAASDGTSVYVATASPDTYGISPNWSDNNIEAILRIGSGATFSGKRADYFVPTDWFDYGINGTQLGAAGVILFDMPGSTPSELALAIGKTSDAYLVDRTNLGGIGGEVAHLESATADWVEGAMAAYSTSEGEYVAMAAPGSFCKNPSDLSTIRIAAGSPPKIAGGWCATQGGAGSPIASASAAASGSQAANDVVVWGLGTNSYLGKGSGKLRAFDGDTGALLAESPTSMPDLEHWISPIVVRGRVYVAGDSHVYAFDLKGATHTPTNPPDAGAGDASAPGSCLLSVAPDQVDPCAPFGMSCQGNPDVSELGNCAIPVAGQACLATVGCSSGLACIDRGGKTFCEPTCTTTSDCTDLFNECEPTADAGTSSCTQAACGPSTDGGGAYYGACAGGTCVPFYLADGTTTGVCMASGGSDGGIEAGANCGASRGGGALCPVGSFCFTGSSTNACLPFCDYTAATYGGDAGGAACGSGQTCVFLGGDLAAGACADSCDADGGTGCSPPFTCQTWNVLTNAAACLP
jgi:outer membrane protein assembly factor BamB